MENSITAPRKKLLLIVNPVSGRKMSVMFLSEVIRIFSEYGYAVTVFPTGARGEAEDYAYRNAADYDLTVCIGGDGTLNEVVNGIVRGGVDMLQGYIPAGSTNDFAVCHGISSDMLTAAQVIMNGQEKLIDLGQFGDRTFTYVAAFGAFTWLTYTTPQNLKNVLGHSAYVLDAVKDIPKIKSSHLRFTSGTSVYEGDYIFGAVCNTTSIAGTLTLPQDQVDTGDGRFEVLLIREPKTLMDFQDILWSVFNMDYSSSLVDFFHAGSLVVESQEPLEWSLDGERGVSGERVEITCIPRRLRLMVDRQ